MRKAICRVLLLFLAATDLSADSSPFKFEGILGNPVENIRNMNSNAAAFIPYNPVVVEIGAYEGQGTLGLAQTYPYGKIFAFEPHPKAYSLLAETLRSFRNVSSINLAINTSNGTAPLGDNGAQSSLIAQNNEAQIAVPCVVLDDWCRDHGVNHIDFLRLDAEGLEWQILRSSPEILETVLVIVTKTYMSPPNRPIRSYAHLKLFLEAQGFELLSHWYQEGKEGEATFVRKYMYDALFR